MVIIFIGDEFKYKKVLQNIIISNLNYSAIYFFNQIDFDIENLIEKYNNVLLITNRETYSTTSKLLTTLNSDSLILKDNLLIPNKTIMYEKNSFVVEIFEKQINVIKIENSEIPNILINSEQIHTIHIFNYDIETAKLFITPLLNSFNIKATFNENEGGWVECYTNKLPLNFIKQLKEIIPKVIITNNIFAYIIERLKENNKKISFAESCTGGLLASYFTKISGSSGAFDGSVVTYSNEIKNKWLGVDLNVLEKFGAVSEATIQEMLLGVLNISDADIGVAISGIAGPTGGTKEKPVGTVFIGISNGDKTIIEKFLFNGNREYIQYQTLMNSIRILINFCKTLDFK